MIGLCCCGDKQSSVRPVAVRVYLLRRALAEAGSTEALLGSHEGKLFRNCWCLLIWGIALHEPAKLLPL